MTASVEPIPLLPPQNTFFNAPFNDQPHQDEVALAGVGYDALSTELGGAAEAPCALRRATASLGAYSITKRKRYKRSQAPLVDAGDISTFRFDPKTTWHNIRMVSSALINAGAIPIMVGGDHSLTYPVITAFAEKYRNLRLIHIDAHCDATDPQDWSCTFNHGTYIRNIIEDGLIPGPRIHQIGIRDYQWRDSGGTYLQEKACNLCTAEEFGLHGTQPLLEKLKDSPQEPTYITFDMDSVDPAFAPGVAEHMPGGLSSREVIALVRALFTSGLRIVGADLVELVPHRDPHGYTTALASNVLGQMVDGLFDTMV